MVHIQAELKASILDSLWYNAKGQALTLQEGIRLFKETSFDNIKRGMVVVNTSAGGHSVSFSAPGQAGQLDPGQFGMLGWLYLNIYNDSRLALVTAGNATPTDDDVFQAMLGDDRLQTVTSVMVDYTMTRYPTYGPTR